MFQHTAARRRLDSFTHPKITFAGFNTQPPEGGWVSWFVFKRQIVVSTHSRPKAAGIDGTDEAIQSEFQHTAARRRLESPVHVIKDEAKVSTHSRPKAAGGFEAARKSTEAVSTHSRPKAAGSWSHSKTRKCLWFQHTAARRRLARAWRIWRGFTKFQHTAARRRLGCFVYAGVARQCVSTHSRPKAAGRIKSSSSSPSTRFNTQPPEGGWADTFQE